MLQALSSYFFFFFGFKVGLIILNICKHSEMIFQSIGNKVYAQFQGFCLQSINAIGVFTPLLKQ